MISFEYVDVWPSIVKFHTQNDAIIYVLYISFQRYSNPFVFNYHDNNVHISMQYKQARWNIQGWLGFVPTNIWPKCYCILEAKTIE